jgi:hypothetical protein
MYACTRSRSSSRAASSGGVAGHSPASVWNPSQMSLRLGPAPDYVWVR